MRKSLKERLKKGEVVLGTWCTVPSSSLVNAIGCSGIDFVIIDGEHGPFDYQTTEDCVRAAEVTDTTAIIRVPANDAHLILKALDSGAVGVQVPHVATKKEAQEVVKAAKYAPQGERGYTPMTRAGKYGLEAEGHAQRSNDKTMVIINIEGSEGLDNLGEIVQVPGIDVIFIGPYDLSQSLGISGDVENPKIVKKIKESAAIMKSKNIACGSYAGNEKFMETLVDCGVQYITYDVDGDMIRKAYADVAQKLNRIRNKKQGALK